MKLIKDMKLQHLIPIVHFLATVLFERILFVFEGNWEVFLPLPREESISNEMELGIVYILSKICAGIIIWLLWKLIFGIIDKKIPKDAVVLFSFIYIIGVIIGLFLFPDYFGIEMDNYSIYLSAIRFLPTYWHSVFTGALYGGCLMVIPHPFSIFLFQWLAFNTVMGYIYCGIRKFWNGKKYQFIILLFLCLPETYNLVFSAYRNNGFTILCLFYFSYLYFAAKEKEVHNNLNEMITIACLSSFVMLWRSEGILIGIGGFLFAFIFIWKLHIKKIVVVMLTLICSFLCLHKIQGIGEEKYYGNDYMILNTMRPLCNILNNPYADLNYDGAESDLAALDAVIPIEVIKQYGSSLSGYRNYNYTLGHADFNQTLADDETSDNYIRAYYRIIMHNIGDYLDVQINSFYASLKIDCKHSTYAYSGDEFVELDNFVYDSWKQGRDMLNETYLTSQWKKNPVRQVISVVVLKMITIWRELWTNSGLNILLHTGTIIVSILLICMELIFVVYEKGKRHLIWVVLFMTVFAEMCAVAMFMPEGRETYMYQVWYTSDMLILFYTIECFGASRRCKERVNEKGEGLQEES